ncbi:MAG: redox-sensing transcriptional repressor Rex [Pirellulales bacterium]
MTDSEPKSNTGETDGAVPKAVVSRLSLYLRQLQQTLLSNQLTISSKELGRLLSFTDAQVRKDLAYFGHFGYPGIGYKCEELVSAIKRILGTDQIWPVALVGMGNLGRALVGYKGFAQRGFTIIAAFDNDTEVVAAGPIDGLPVYHLDNLPEVARQNRIRLGMIAVPGPAAQSVADRLVAVGVEGILNFAPVTIKLPEGVSQVGVDLAIELEQLTFSVVNRGATT